jgi:Alpha/beta hydrolase family
MATYVLIPGAGGEAWYWHLVVPLLEAAGHGAIAVELPAGDEEAGLDAYADAAVAAMDDRGTWDDLVVVGQSLGGFTAPIVADRVGAAGLVFVAAMIPGPGERAGEWWDTSGFRDHWGDREMDEVEDFLHDLPPALLEEVMARGEVQQTGRPMEDPFPLDRLPAVPTRGIAATNDRFFGLAFMERLIRDRLGVEPEHVESGHLPALANPQGLVDVLLNTN